MTTDPNRVGSALLGLEFIQRYDLLFDLRALRSRRTRLYYSKRFDETDAWQPVSGISAPGYASPLHMEFILDERGYGIAVVSGPGFLYDELGLRPGMIITGINGQNILEIEPAEFSRILSLMHNSGEGELTIIDTDGTERVIRRDRQ